MAEDPVYAADLDGAEDARRFTSNEEFGFYSSEPWYTVMRGLDESACGYLVARDAEGVAGVAGVSLPDVEETAGNAPHRLFPQRHPMPYVLLGARRGYLNNLPVRTPDAAGRLLRDAAELGLRNGRHWAYALHLSSATADALSRSRAALPVLSPLVDTWIPLRGESLDEHYATVSGNRRRKVAAERRRTASLGLTFGRERLADCIEWILPLRKETFQRNGSPRTPESMRRELRLMSEHLEEYEVLLTARDADGVFCGYSLSYVWGGRLWERSLGVLDSFRKATPLVFELEFNRPLEFCLAARLGALHLGPTNYYAKMRRGAVAAPMWQASLMNGTEVFPPEGVARWTDHLLSGLRDECGGALDEDYFHSVRRQALGYASVFTEGAGAAIPEVVAP